MDGSNNEIIKLFRETNANIFEEQISICNKLNEYNANICINIVAHKGNLNDIYNLTNVLNNLPYIKKWQIFQYSPIGKFGKLNKKSFEITEEEFLAYKSEILKNYKYNKNKIEFKSSISRDKTYMLIDNSGYAWISLFDPTMNNKKYIGNILNPNDWDKIIYNLKNKVR